MKPPTLRTSLFLAVDAALLAVCIAYIPALIESARLPFAALAVDDHLQVVSITDKEAAGRIVPGDRIMRWNGENVGSISDLEFLRSYHAPGDTVVLTLEGGRESRCVCVKSYDGLYILIILLVGFLTWSFGVFVLLAGPQGLVTATLHWSLVCMGASTIMTWGSIVPGGFFPYLARGIFLVVYLGVPSLFLFFTSMFPRPRPGPLWVKAVSAFVPVSILLVILSVTLFHSLHEHSLLMFRSFQRWYDVFHIVLILDVAMGLISIVDSYRRSETRMDRKKIEWILWGLTFGPTPFLILVVLPGLFEAQDIIPEELSIVFFLLIPASFAIAFLKYRVLDIELVIKRTTAYAVVLGVVLALYTAAVGLLSAIAGSFVPQANAAAAVGVAIAFEPLRRRVQHFVDRRFFRVRQTGRSILEAVASAVDERQLGEVVVGRTDEVIPVERIALVVADPGSDTLDVLAGRGWERGALRRAKLPLHSGGGVRGPFAADRTFEPGIAHRTIPAELAGDPGIAAVFPLTDENQNVLGCIALGPKRSSARFTAEDADLLMEIAAESALALGRIRLQRQLLLEQVTSRRLEELNQMKSNFVSYVSHELRTPLTSIKMFAEILQSGRVRLGRKAREYIGVIEGESDRLGRMVTTILDSARIEQGVKEYRPVRGDLREIVRKALGAMCYQLKQHGFVVRFTEPRKPLHILADPDAVVQAVVNIIANAIKYSPGRRYLAVTLTRRRDAAACSIRDRGRGIPPAALPHLFERFYRVPDVRRDIQGVGLGLPLVHHIMEAHRGSVEVESTVGKGTTFTLVFPAPVATEPEAAPGKGNRR